MVKTPSGIEHWTVDLRPLPKIIEQVKKVDPDVFLVGFKAEYDITEKELLRRATKRMGEADMDMIVANDVSKDQVGFGTDTNEVFIIDRGGEVTHVPLSSKREVADQLLNKVKEKMTG
jgi:phosphopantothenoylcysteine decarboxylase/phosphopantothenate--cysteine ligase